MFFLCTITLLELFASPLKEGQITVRGFLIEASGEYYLSLKPDVPSCCAGKEGQLKVRGKGLKASRRVQEITGVLKQEGTQYVLISERA